MSDSKKVVGRPWKKGQSGNPAGKPPLPPEVKALKKLTQADFETYAVTYLRMSISELERLENTKTLTTLEGIIIKNLIKAVKEGSTSDLNFYLERMFGKVAQNLNVSTNLNQSITEFIAQRKQFKNE